MPPITPSISADLRRTVRMVGDALGTVLQEQGGDALLSTVESLRQSAIVERRGGRRAGRLSQLVTDLSPAEATQAIRAFGTYFLLINLAEEAERLRRLRAREIREHPLPR